MAMIVRMSSVTARDSISGSMCMCMRGELATMPRGAGQRRDIVFTYHSQILTLAFPSPFEEKRQD